MKKIKLSFLLILTGITFTFAQSSKEKAPTTYRNKDFHVVYSPTFENDGTQKKVKNVILMIGDGMGLAQVSAAMYANKNQLTITNLHNIGLIKTNSASDFTTDSAASGTAYATGRKTNNGALGVDPEGKSMINMTEFLSARNYATGIITTDKISGATPSAFYAHQPKRNMTAEILTDLLETPALFVAGGSTSLYKSIGTEKMDALKKKGFKLIHDYKKLSDLNADRIALIPGKEDSGSIKDGRARDYLSYTTRQAIRFLSQKSDQGFFLMVEGAQIDFGGHANDIEFIVRETLDFDKAVAEALKFADENKETLVIITADHETGGMALRDGDIEKATIKARFTTGGHSPIMVPVYSYGPHAGTFRGVMENTEIFHRIISVLEWVSE